MCERVWWSGRLLRCFWADSIGEKAVFSTHGRWNLVRVDQESRIERALDTLGQEVGSTFLRLRADPSPAGSHDGRGGSAGSVIAAAGHQPRAGTGRRPAIVRRGLRAIGRIGFFARHWQGQHRFSGALLEQAHGTACRVERVRMWPWPAGVGLVSRESAWRREGDCGLAAGSHGYLGRGRHTAALRQHQSSRPSGRRMRHFQHLAAHTGRGHMHL